jgi:ESS family glutamate:Na+ symporter
MVGHLGGKQVTYEIQGVQVLIIAIAVWFLGVWFTGKVRILSKYSIPAAVTGGLICSTVVALIYVLGGVEVSFDLRLRDLCLLIFFSTIGLSAKLRLLKAGGRMLAILLAIASVFLVVQNITGVLLAKLFGAHPAYGLFCGSISFAGGHGTAIAWGKVTEAAGLTGAAELGIACATFGLIAGGLIGGPIAQRLINKHGLSPVKSGQTPAHEQNAPASEQQAPDIPNVLKAVLLLAICLGAGDSVNRFLFAEGVMLPGFLTAMLVGILITNLAEMGKAKIPTADIARLGEICLQLFLAMSLMSMQLWSLAQAMGPILIVLIVQMTVITIFVVFLVFRLMGRSYDAAIISAGFAGLGLGATPVGIANMKAVTDKYGPSPAAFLVVPLVGAFFIDLVNAIVIKMFAASPLLQQPLP